MHQGSHRTETCTWYDLCSAIGTVVQFRRMKITNRQLSLRGMRTFCAAARHMSFRVAGEKLFVTASAVSHQIKNLEEELGVSLFSRANRSLELTDAGQALFDELDPLMREIDQVTARFRARADRRTLRISVQPFFASELFVPKLAEFIELHPEIDMHIDTSDESPEKHPASADVSIRVFRRAPPDLAADAFFPLRLVPACTKSLRKKVLAGKKRPAGPFPIIVHTRRSNQWQWWSDSAGIEIPEPANIVQLDSTVAVVRAAEQGLGVALVPMPASARLFESGQLVRLYDHEAISPERYYFVSSHEAASSEPVRELRKWVLTTFTPMA